LPDVRLVSPVLSISRSKDRAGARTCRLSVVAAANGAIARIGSPISATLLRGFSSVLK